MQLSEKKTEAGEFLFYKEFDDVEEGEYQYKFRLGLGDWWVLDETAEAGKIPLWVCWAVLLTHKKSNG